MARPQCPPTYYIGPVSVWLTYDDDDEPRAAVAYVGTLCVGEYFHGGISVATDDDVDATTHATNTTGTQQGGVDMLDGLLLKWLGAST